VAPNQTTAVAISHDGRFLADGTRRGFSSKGKDLLQIWEVATGERVSVVEVPGGVGWPGYERCIQWSSDDELLGLVHGKNHIAVVEPFAQAWRPKLTIDGTANSPRPPAWCWHPQGQSIAISCSSPTSIPLAVVDVGELDGSMLRRDQLRWFDGGGGPDLKPLRQVSFDESGDRVFGFNRQNQAYCVDVNDRDLKWQAKVGDHVAFSPDGQVYAHDLAGLVFYSTDNGLPTLNLPMHLGGSQMVFWPGREARRMAMVVVEGNPFMAEAGVHLYEDDEYVASLDVVPHCGDNSSRLGDPRTFAWSPDGRRGAVFTAESKIEIWTCGADPKPIFQRRIDENAAGILWGADDSLMAVGPEGIEFFTGKD
jgi:hypothetical protein